MAKKQTVEALETQRAALVEKIKRIDTAIRIARDNERAEKSKKLLDALAKQGLLDADPDELIARLSAPKSVPTQPVAANPSRP